MKTALKNKLSESIQAVLPILAIVLALALTVAPIPSGVLLAFLAGGVLLTVGMMFFSLGAEMAMDTMGQRLGTYITKTKKLSLILLSGLALGVLITVSEPDLQVLANQIESIPNKVLIFSVAGGVGLFLVIAILRMLFGIPLRVMLIISYALVFILALAAPDSFLAVAFDSGGVTTGPMTVPFIMAFGIGIAAIRNDKNSADDSFGLISLCSVGPIIAVLLLSLIYRPDSASYRETWLPDVSHSVELRELFLSALPTYFKEMAGALLPIAAFFGLFQLLALRLRKKTLQRIGIGIFYTYIGLVLFLTGVNVGFLPAGTYLGSVLAGLSANWIIVPVGMLVGFFIVKAEPAIYVLMQQVEELTNGAIRGALLQRSLCVSVSVSIGLSMLRILLGIPILRFMLPGYGIALLLTFFSPKIFTAIAFDSGGVASGPMTATFLLPFAMGACKALGGNVVTDAFGVVAMVAMTPLIVIQLLGVAFRLKQKKLRAGGELCRDGGEEEIIEL